MSTKCGGGSAGAGSSLNSASVLGKSEEGLVLVSDEGVFWLYIAGGRSDIESVGFCGGWYEG